MASKKSFMKPFGIISYYKAPECFKQVENEKLVPFSFF